MKQATSTSPLVQDGQKLTRRFLGNLFPTNTAESNELKSYVKGHDTYTYGRDYIKGVGFVPKQHDVRQQYFYQ